MGNNDCENSEHIVKPACRGLHNALLAACGALSWKIDMPDPCRETGVESVSGKHLIRHPRIQASTSEEARQWMGLPYAERVCIVLIDGMGFHQIRRRLGHTPTLRDLGAGEDHAYATTVAPSTTAAALTSFATGLLPAQTSMLSYSLRDPATGRLFDLISFRESPYKPQEWQTQPTIFERLGTRARNTVLIEDPKYENSGLTLAAWRGAPAIFTRHLRARVRSAQQELVAGRQLVYLYWAGLDHCGHTYGVDSPQWINELENVDAALGELILGVPRGTLVIVTADHGMVHDSCKLDCAHDPVLNCGVRAVAGEERAFHVYTDEPDALAQRWREYLADRAWIWKKNELRTLGLYGAFSKQAYRAMGDVVAFARNTTGFVDSRVLSEHAIAMPGVHGSLTAEEMHIPWLVRYVE